VPVISRAISESRIIKNNVDLANLETGQLYLEFKISSQRVSTPPSRQNTTCIKAIMQLNENKPIEHLRFFET
jgi:hypothetical protein